MILDTHLHESLYSADSFLPFQDAIATAKERGLQGICITNHDNNDLRDLIGDSAWIDGILVIVGSEVYTKEGDILTFGLKDIPPLKEERIPAEELLRRVRQAGGVAIAAHPFRHNNRGIKHHMIRLASMLDAVESFNGSTKAEDNLRCLELAHQLKLPSTGASDAHIKKQVGVFATRFPYPLRDQKDFIEAIRSGNFHPVALEKDRYIDLSSSWLPQNNHQTLHLSEKAPK